VINKYHEKEDNDNKSFPIKVEYDEPVELTKSNNLLGSLVSTLD
jgi:hypothetical protein